VNQISRPVGILNDSECSDFALDPDQGLAELSIWSGFRSTWLTEAALTLWFFEQITPFK
jgi:hypothetical protein